MYLLLNTSRHPVRIFPFSLQFFPFRADFIEIFCFWPEIMTFNSAPQCCQMRFKMYFFKHDSSPCSNQIAGSFETDCHTEIRFLQTSNITSMQRPLSSLTILLVEVPARSLSVIEICHMNVMYPIAILTSLSS